MNFYPYPAVAISKQKNGLIAADKSSLQSFWQKVDSLYGEDASSGVGCYVFSIRAGKGILPWYVGLAEKQSLRKECFTPHKINHYNNAIAARKGTPLLTVIPKYTPKWSLSSPNPSGHRDIQQLEVMLIGNCLTRNKSLLNLRDTKLLREMVVPGLLNSPKGKPANEVQEFKELLGL
ncbi:hypothetical protein V3391_12690 [Luteimonas sp. SMYT11W]|uniref:Uncharacterized protein n=1 Tax=Luteimonas flava TaxID=3115822 RepID=A0ABU7WHS1_9GAMM